MSAAPAITSPKAITRPTIAPLASFAVAPEWTPRAIELAKVWVSRHAHVFGGARTPSSFLGQVGEGAAPQ